MNRKTWIFGLGTWVGLLAIQLGSPLFAEDLSGSEAVIILKIPSGAEVSVDQRSVGSQSRLRYDGLLQDQLYAIEVTVSVPDGTSVSKNIKFRG